MAMIIDRLGDGDRDDWFDLWHQSDGWDLENNRPDIPESNWREIMSDEGRLRAFCLRDEADGKIAGYILYRFNVCIKTAGDECFICDVFVRPDRRNGGNGTRLVRAVEEEAEKLKAGRISWIADSTRPDLMRFYARTKAQRTKHVFFVRWIES